MTPHVDIGAAVRSYLREWDRGTSHRLSTRVIHPCLMYQYVSGENPDRPFRPIGWRVFLRTTDTRDVMALDALTTAGGFAWRLYAGEPGGPWLAQIRRVERRKRIRGTPHDLNLVLVPPIHASFIWIARRDGGEDAFVPLGAEVGSRKREASLNLAGLREFAESRLERRRELARSFDAG